MLPPIINEALNEQVALEHYSSNLYLAMSSWCLSQGYEGAGRFLDAHSVEEMAHMKKLFSYINETGAVAIVSAIEQPPVEFDSLRHVFETTLAHERHITSEINSLVKLALKESDFSTFNFLQWYVSEQHEEEKLFQSIIDKIDIIGVDGKGLYMIDKEIGSLL